jgi:hypothetical protein
MLPPRPNRKKRMIKIKVPPAKDEPNWTLAYDMINLKPEHQRIIKATRLRVLKERGLLR